MPGKVSYSADIYQAAYDLWAFVFDGNTRRVSKALAANKTPVPHTTIGYWALSHGWDERKRSELQSAVPGVHRLNLGHLVFGSLEGFQTLRAIARHDDKTIDASHNRNRVTAAMALIDRAGYAPRHAASGEHRPNLPALATDLELSDDDLANALLGYYSPPAISEGTTVSESPIEVEIRELVATE